VIVKDDDGLQWIVWIYP